MAGTRRKDPSQYDFLKQHFDEVLLPTSGAKRRSSVRTRKIRHIDIHHMAVKDSNNGAANFKCLEIWDDREASAHYCVDNRYVLQPVYDNRMAWGNGNGTANQEGIIVEHANSVLGDKAGWPISENTLETSAKLVAGLHITHKLGRPTSSGFGTGGTIRTHQSFFATACPGPYFKKVWSRYVGMIQAAYDVMVKGETPTVPPVVAPATTHVVAPGDTLSRIAKANRLDLDDLASWNGITDKDVIRVGQLLTLVKPDVIPPVCPVPDPAEPTPPASTITYVEDTVVVLNGAGYNAARGKTTALKRLPDMVKSLKADQPAVAILVEWSRPMLATSDKLMTGYHRGLLPGRKATDANGAGREVYVRDDMEILAVVEGDVKTKLQLPGEAKPDDKPLLAVVYRPKKGGLPRLATAFHNENQDGRDVKTKLDADTIRVRQIREGLQFSIDVADDHKVPYYNIDHAGDGNSYGWALDEAERMNWKSALASATTKGDDVPLRTHNNWDNARVKAGHFDLGLVRHYVDVLEGDQTFDPNLSDHNKLTYRRKYQLTNA